MPIAPHRRPRGIRPVAAAILAALAAPALRAGAMSPVERPELRSPDRLVFEGAAAYPPDTIRRAMARDVPHIRAAVLEPDLATYLATVARRVRDGYLAGGYPDARVSAAPAPDDANITVRIEEGDRYTAGPVTVTGNRALDAAAIAASLTDPEPAPTYTVPVALSARPPGRAEAATATDGTRGVRRRSESRKPLWKPGKPADFSTALAARAAARVRERYARAGLPQATVSASIEKRDAGATAVLSVRVEDEGPRAVLGEVMVEGLSRIDRGQLLDYLEIRPGMPVDGALTDRIDDRLYRAARFFDYEIRLGAAVGSDVPVPLLIRVEERRGCRPLDEPFGAEERAWLALRDWISAPEAWTNDLVLTVALSNTVVGVVYAPTQGVLVTASPPGATNPLFAAWITATNTTLAMLRAEAQRLDLPPPGAVELQIQVSPDLDRTDATEQKWWMTAGLGVRAAANREGAAVFRPSIRVPPAAFADRGSVARERLPGYAFSVSGDVARVTTDELRLAFDARTGALESLGAVASNTGARVEIAAVRGALAARCRQLAPVAAAAPDRFDAARAASSPAGFVLALADAVCEAVAGPGQAKAIAALRLARTALALDVLAPLDRRLAARAPSGPAQPAFDIPAPDDDAPGPRGPLAAVAGFAIALPYALFDWDAMPCAIGRALGFILLGEARLAAQEVDALAKRPDLGPVGCWLTAEALRMHAPTRTRFAELGMQRLAGDAVEHDFAAILHPDSASGRASGGLGDAWAALTAAERTNVLSLLQLPGAAMPAVEVLVGRLRAAPPEDRTAIARALLKLLWNRAGRTALRDRLRACGARPVAYVGDRVILEPELAQSARARLANPDFTPPPGADRDGALRAAREAAIESLLDRNLALCEAAADGTPPPGEAEVDAAVRAVAEQHFRGDMAAMEARLRRAGRDMAAFRADLAEDLLVQGRLRAIAAERVDPAVVRRFYDEHPEAFTTTERIHLAAIVLGSNPAAPSAARDAARDILARIRGGESFEALAKARSQGRRTAAAGGDWGWRDLTDYRPEMVAALRDVQTGETAPAPVEAGGKLYILKLLGRRPGGLRPFDEVRRSIEAALIRKESEPARLAWRERVEKRFPVIRLADPAAAPAADPADRSPRDE